MMKRLLSILRAAQKVLSVALDVISAVVTTVTQVLDKSGDSTDALAAA
ncbi:MAG TPA: hypothetical protein VFM18_08695 [Methanosarcina sp.]|nr:hypothetical protein [Methanosarcina sp.]